MKSEGERGRASNSTPAGSEQSMWLGAAFAPVNQGRGEGWDDEKDDSDAISTVRPNSAPRKVQRGNNWGPAA